MSEVLRLLQSTSLFFRTYVRKEGNTVYGSLLWRIVLLCSNQIRKKSAVSHRQVLLDVVNEIDKAKSDIDMFVDAEAKFDLPEFELNEDEVVEHTYQHSPRRVVRVRGGGRGRGRGRGRKHNYGWLAYRHETQILAKYKTQLVTDLAECKNLGTMSTVMACVRQLMRTDANLDIETYDIVQPVGDLRIMFQVHQMRDCKPEQTPAAILDEIIAPFFTVETLMWTSGQGLTSRFGVPMEVAIQHIEKRELHFANVRELSEHLNDDRTDTELLDRLAGRLMKYKKYGFKLCISKEELDCCEFLPRMIERMMMEHIEPRNAVQKRKISKGIRMARAGDNPTFIRMSDDCWAVQSLHNDYVACVVGENRGVPHEVAALIAGFAARADENVYYEDPLWRKEVRQARERIEMAQLALKRILHPKEDPEEKEEQPTHVNTNVMVDVNVDHVDEHAHVPDAVADEEAGPIEDNESVHSDNESFHSYNQSVHSYGY